MSNNWANLLKKRTGELAAQPATPVVSAPVVEQAKPAVEPEKPTALDLWLRSVDLTDWPEETCWIVQQGDGRFAVVTDSEMVRVATLAEQHNAEAQQKWQRQQERAGNVDDSRHSAKRPVRHRGVSGLFDSPGVHEAARSGTAGELQQSPSGKGQLPSERPAGGKK